MRKTATNAIYLRPVVATHIGTLDITLRIIWLLSAKTHLKTGNGRIYGARFGISPLYTILILRSAGKAEMSSIFGWIVDKLKRDGLGDEEIDRELVDKYGWVTYTTKVTRRATSNSRKLGWYVLQRKRAEKNRER